MADVTINDLPSISTPLSGTEVLHLIQSSSDVKMTATALANFVMNVSTYSPIVIAVTGATHTVSTTIRKQLINFTVSSDCTVTMPGTYGDAKELIFRNTSSSTANVIGFGDGLVLLPNQEATYIWDGSAWVRRYFSFNSIYQITNANYVGLNGDGFNEIHINPTTAAHEYTLPNPVTNLGRKIRVENTGDGTYKITVNAYGATYINVTSGNDVWDLTTFELLQANDFVEFTSDGTNWKKTNAPYWHLFNNPATGNKAAQSTWTADSFSGGLEVTFSELPIGTLAAKFRASAVNTTVVNESLYWRKSGDSNISNTPHAASEIANALLFAAATGIAMIEQVEAWMNDERKTQFAMRYTNGQMTMSYPYVYLQ